MDILGNSRLIQGMKYVGNEEDRYTSLCLNTRYQNEAINTLSIRLLLCQILPEFEVLSSTRL